MEKSIFKNQDTIGIRRKGRSFFRGFLNNAQGSIAIEYSLIGSLVAVGIISGVGATRESITDTFSSIAATMSELSEPAPSASPITANSPDP
ncbi:MAG: Flp family type IVb pilin [Hyphomicrobiales bacterium]